MAFVGKGHSKPVVIGCIWDLTNRPPKHSTAKVSDSKVYQTRKHRMEFIDEEGKESIIVSSAEGQMRIELSKNGGLNLINELGDIKIKCRKLKMEGKEGVQIEAEQVAIAANDVNIKADNRIKIKSDGEVAIRSRNIQLRGSRGVVAEGKQMAAAQDNVQGFDIHRMRIPSGNGTRVVPLPHPFLGRLADRLSPDVKINRQNAATEGSIAKHNSPVHNQLPGTIRFENNPNRQGEVTGGTAKTVKINGKEAAVIGSTVTTCNDTGARNNSVVMAPGMHMPMPDIIHPKNTEAWHKERAERQKVHPLFTVVRSNKDSEKEGQAIELYAQVQDIADGTPVTLLIFKNDQDPASHVPFAKVITVVKDGVAKAPWVYWHSAHAELPEHDLEFFVVAYSAWCQPKRSDNFTVELLRPEMPDSQWQNKDESQTEKSLVGEMLKLMVNCINMEEGALVTFRVYAEGANPKYDKPVFQAIAPNIQGRAVAEWEYQYQHDPDNPLTKKPKFFFTANSLRCKEVGSELVEIGMKVALRVCYDDGECIEGLEYTLTGADGTEEKGATDSGGMIESNTILPANYKLTLNWEAYKPGDTENKIVELETQGEQWQIVDVQPGDKQFDFELTPRRDYILCIDPFGKKVSR